jgi:hypothetical protein
MIVSVQRPVIKNRNKNQNKFEQRNLINRTNLNRDNFVSVKGQNNINFLGLERKIITNINRLEEHLKPNKSFWDSFLEITNTPKKITDLTNNLNITFKQIINNNDIELAEEFVGKLIEKPNACVEILGNKLKNDNDSCKSLFSILLTKSISEKRRLVRTWEEKGAISNFNLRREYILSNDDIDKINRWEKLPEKVLLNINEIKPDLAQKLVMENSDNFSELVIREMYPTIKTIKIVLKNNADKYIKLINHTNRDNYHNEISALEHAGKKGPETLKVVLDGLNNNEFSGIARNSKDLDFTINFTKYLKDMGPSYLSIEQKDRIIAKSMYSSLKEDLYSNNSLQKWNNLKDNEKSYIKSIIEDLRNGNSICIYAKESLKNVLPIELNNKKNTI